MTCLQAILTIMLSLATYHRDSGDTAAERRALYTPVAQAICQATTVRWERAWLIAQANHETHFARFVLEERCEDGPPGERCDWSKKLGAPTSHGPWQSKLRWCRGCRRGATRLARFIAGARYVLGIARLGRAKCDTFEGAFAYQRGAGQCTAKWAPMRVVTMQRILGRMP